MDFSCMLFFPPTAKISTFILPEELHINIYLTVSRLCFALKMLKNELLNIQIP